MFKNKRSFFERITGSVSFPEDEREIDRLTGQKKVDNQAQKDSEWLQNEEEGELAVDVYQTPNEIIIKAMISGVRPDELSVSINRETVTIKGKREESEVIRHEDYYQKELYWGAFTRTILLPGEIDVDAAEASEKHGLLTIRLPKIDKARVQKLKVKSG